jgi:hypothetical protein
VEHPARSFCYAAAIHPPGATAFDSVACTCARTLSGELQFNRLLIIVKGSHSLDVPLVIAQL